MSKWTTEYNKKLTGIEDAILSLPKRATVIIGMAAMEAQGFLTSIHKYKDHFEFLKIATCLNLGDFPFCQEEEFKGKFCNDNWFFGPGTR